MPKRLIMVILADDAVKGPQRYTTIGPNSRARIADVVKQYEAMDIIAPVVWMFGAGADTAHREGPTLAELNEAALRQYLPDAQMVVNRYERDAYGTFEEIEWVVTQARKQFPKDELRFVFWSQPRHLVRVRRIVTWFFFGINARYRPTVQTKEIPRLHELQAHLKLIAIKCGLRQLVLWLRRNTELTYDDA